MRQIEFANGEYYHLFTHGVEDRDIFQDAQDFKRFLECLVVFNTVKPTQSLFNTKLLKHGVNLQEARADNPLVNIIAYGLNPNHYHIILEQIHDGGISEFMKRINGGHAQYYNIRNERRGTLFESRFKAKHIGTNEYLLNVSAYVNLNNVVHGLSSPTAQFRSSWNEYIAPEQVKVPLCKKDIILSQFNNSEEYKKFAEDAVRYIKSQRETPSPMSDLLLENFLASRQLNS